MKTHSKSVTLSEAEGLTSVILSEAATGGGVEGRWAERSQQRGIRRRAGERRTLA
jgi:hypothetical protein